MKKLNFDLTNKNGVETNTIYVKSLYDKTKVSTLTYYVDDETIAKYVDVPFDVECWHLSKKMLPGCELLTLEHYKNGRIVDTDMVDSSKCVDADGYASAITRCVGSLWNLTAV